MTLRERWQDYQDRKIAKSKAPILVGPWRSEVGFECLYWIPWLTKWLQRYQIDPARLVVISRGGAASWYPAGQHVELYSYVPVASVRRAMLAGTMNHGTVKQYGITAQEQKLLPVIAEDLGIRRYHVLHPSRMYHSLTPWFNSQVGLAQAIEQLSFGPMHVSPLPLELPLPTNFIAVSFYARSTWPMEEEMSEWVQSLIDGLQKIAPVVALESGLHADEHMGFTMPNGVLSTAKWCTPQNNLAIQAAVLAKASAFVGTYGGTMQLAVRMQKPSVGFFQQFSGTAYAHKMLTEWLGTEQKTPVLIGRPTDAKYVQEVMQVNYLPAVQQRGSSQVKQPA